jgi:hypothetical protein
MRTREKTINRDEAVLRAKVTLTKDQLAAILQTLNDGTWGTNWKGVPKGTLAVWVPLEQVGIEYTVMSADGHPSIAQ